MSKTIVTTTINPVTEALGLYSNMEGWDLIIVGDKKTPHEEYEALAKKNNVTYLSPEKQEELYPDLSEVIGWNCIQRRSLGLIYAYQNFYDIVASVDDDNIPYSYWGKDVDVGKKVKIPQYTCDSYIVTDPVTVAGREDIWHRGFPLELIHFKNNISYLGEVEVDCLVQADLWDGDPDVDAICRLLYKPTAIFKNGKFTVKSYSPFNSQNTFLHRSAIKDYPLFPGVGRFDDIWASYYFERLNPGRVIYGKATVFQDRNDHNIWNDFDNELYGYKNNVEALVNGVERYLPAKSQKFLELYKKYFI